MFPIKGGFENLRVACRSLKQSHAGKQSDLLSLALGATKMKQREEGGLMAPWKTDFSNIWHLEENSDLSIIQLELRTVSPSPCPDPRMKAAMGVLLESSFTSHLSAKLLYAIKVVSSFWRLEVSKHGSDDHLPSSREPSKHRPGDWT